jgi:uncharacterized membrane protein YtjA (UPF0391 family)
MAMLRLALLFFVLAVVAGVLGFGGWAGAFTSLAVIAFYVFGAFLIFSLLAGLVGAGHWRSGGAFASLIIAGLVGAGVYAWVDHDMSAQELGAALDRNASHITADAGDAVQTASAETKQLLGKVGDSTKDAANDVGEKMDADK